jgi:hypothetical protein
MTTRSKNGARRRCLDRDCGVDVSIGKFLQNANVRFKGRAGDDFAERVLPPRNADV